MSRWIDVEWVRNRIDDTCSLKTISLRNLFHILTVAPGIDIVRCGECKYWHKNRKAGDGVSVFDICYDFQAYDFCSYGEREDE